MNSEYGQSSSKENSIEQRKPMEELKRMNQPSSAPQQTAQPIQPIVIQDEDEDAEEKRRRMEAKIAAENFGAVIGFAAGAALAVKEKLDEQAAREEQKKQQHEQTMGGL